MPPSSLAKMKTDAAGALPGAETLKAVLSVLKTCPVGAACPPAVVGVIATTRWAAGGGGCWTPFPSYSVATPAPLSEIQNGVVGPNEMPHAFTKCGSWWAAGMSGVLETRF